MTKTMTKTMTNEREYTAKFVLESWMIEGEHEYLIQNPQYFVRLVDLHKHFIALNELPTVYLLERAANAFADGKLRSQFGMNVRVGNHIAPPGGPIVTYALENILQMHTEGQHPYITHRAFERLHPFTDGNGRVGRLLWAWCMDSSGLSWRKNGFLKTWYYQSLEIGSRNLASV